ncbi:MAG: sigma-54 dependent transcriptional regulator [Bdellovibrionota bacterium]
MLIVGFNPSLAISIGRWAESRGISLVTARDPDEALKVGGVDSLVWVTETDPYEIPPVLARLAQNCRALVCLPHYAMGLARRALDQGFADYLGIPTEESILFERLDRLRPQPPTPPVVQVRIDDQDLEAMGIELRSSEAGRRLIESLETVAPFPTTVLFEGETGVGKEAAARLLHKISPRSGAPFVAVHLAALSREVIESELFGHVKGAFTGAVQSRKGAFELANGGTLFLDEISEVALDIQVKLLRVIQGREYWPVGAEKPLHANCRLIAATNRDLANEVQEGRFREDLYYRLAVYPIRIAPLRERMEGLASLVARLLQGISGRLGIPAKELSETAWKLLRSHSWPGNIRELENVLERAAIRAKSGPITADHLTIDLKNIPEAIGVSIHPVVRDADLGASFSLDDVMERIELAIIQRAFLKAGGTLSEAARLLGIPRSTLYNRLIKRGINPGGDKSVN